MVMRRVKALVSRIVSAIVNDLAGLQEIQYTAHVGEIDSAERLQQYGFTSNPLAGAEGIVIELNADTPIILVIDDRRYRLKPLAPGEVAMYDDLGQYVKLSRNGIVVESTSIKLGATATLAGARSGDTVAGDAATAVWVGQVTSAINGAWPGSVTPIANVTGTITSGSAIAKVA